MTVVFTPSITNGVRRFFSLRICLKRSFFFSGVSGRSTLGFDEWVRLDIDYIQRRSFRLDIEILLRTIPAVLSCRGAY